MATASLPNVLSKSTFLNLKRSQSILGPSEDRFFSFPVQSHYPPSNIVEKKPFCTPDKKNSLSKNTTFCRASSFREKKFFGKSLSQFPNPKIDEKNIFPKLVVSRKREFIPKAQSLPVSEIGTENLTETVTEAVLETVTDTVTEIGTKNRTETVPKHETETGTGHGTETVDMEQEGEEGTGKGKFVWKKNWYPVALIEDLPVSKPVPFQLLGINMVLWRDSEGRWRAFRDSCPHRLAPLSEGRITPEGLLQCSYHGWAFSGTGTCQLLPQAQKEGPEGRARESSRACAQTDRKSVV